jgi:hypothetical protein
MEISYDSDYCFEEYQTEHGNSVVHFVQVLVLNAAKKKKMSKEWSVNVEVHVNKLEDALC